MSNNGLDTNHLQAAGHIDNVIKQSYLNLSIDSPESKDSGLYTCVMYFLDEFGILKEERANKKLTEEKYIMLTPLEQILLKEISSLKQKVTAMVAFSATNNVTSINPRAGMVLAFPDIIMKEGEGYNPHTGVFTAPRPGFYTFNVIGYAGCTDCLIHLSIQANDQVLARLLIGDKDFHDQSSISTFVDLSEGDEVKVVVGTLNGGASFYYGQNTVFTGYLVKPH